MSKKLGQDGLDGSEKGEKIENKINGVEVITEEREKGKCRAKTKRPRKG